VEATVWDRGEYQAAPAADHGTLKCKMGFAPVFGVPDEIETANQIKIEGLSVRPTHQPPRLESWQDIDLSKISQQESGYFENRSW
jgi:hypothetical protein